MSHSHYPYGIEASLIKQELAQRPSSSLASKLTAVEDFDKHDKIGLVCAAADIGVQLNQGRRGAAWAPQCILASLKKMNSLNIDRVPYQFVSTQKDEAENYLQAIQKQQARLQKAIQQVPSLIHLGGGHDHLYPLGMAVAKNKKLFIINIDAHADTRVDRFPHSGNPFRRLDQERPIHLLQIGLHPQANAASTLSELKQSSQWRVWRSQISHYSHLADCAELQSQWNAWAKEIDPDSFLLFSLDFDGLDQSVMPAVSAPNPDGLSLVQLFYLMDRFHQIKKATNCAHAWGFYEFNPLFETPSLSASRVAASILWRALSYVEIQK